MRSMILVIALLTLLPLSLQASDVEDHDELEILYGADQAVRSKEAIEAGRAPSLQEERERRIAVMRLLSEGNVQTANDFFHAGIILHHTSSYRGSDGERVSLGAENHLLAFFLFQRAHERGHNSGLPMMAAAYNYYLRACGEDASVFGFQFAEDGPVWRPEARPEEVEALKCGFDPRPYME